MQDKNFKSYKDQKIWLEEFKEALTALDPVWDLGSSAASETFGSDTH